MKLLRANPRVFFDSIGSIPEPNRPDLFALITNFSSESSTEGMPSQVKLYSEFFRFDGLKTLFVEDVKPRSGRGVDLNSPFVAPYIQSVELIMDTLCQTKVIREEAYAKEGDVIRGDLSTVIAINSSAYEGSMALSFEKGFFLGIVERMLEEKYTEINEENQDAAGEICNQVFGNAKRILNKQGYDIQTALPSLVEGAQHSIKHLVSGPTIAVKFKSDVGSFIFELALKAR